MSSNETSTQEPLLTTSFTLMSIAADLLPKDEVACQTCPMALWQLSGKTVRCYCRVLFGFAWESHDPGKITICDGPALAQVAVAD